MHIGDKPRTTRMFEEFSRSYYLGRLYVEPGGDGAARLCRVQHERISEQLYADGEGVERLDRPLVMKLGTNHFPVHSGESVPADTLAVPEPLLDDAVHNPRRCVRCFSRKPTGHCSYSNSPARGGGNRPTVGQPENRQAPAETIETELSIRVSPSTVVVSERKQNNPRATSRMSHVRRERPSVPLRREVSEPQRVALDTVSRGRVANSGSSSVHSKRSYRCDRTSPSAIPNGPMSVVCVH
jgi:hypothetical protein